MSAAAEFPTSRPDRIGPPQQGQLSSFVDGFTAAYGAALPHIAQRFSLLEASKLSLGVRRVASDTGLTARETSAVQAWMQERRDETGVPAPRLYRLLWTSAHTDPNLIDRIQLSDVLPNSGSTDGVRLTLVERAAEEFPHQPEIQHGIIQAWHETQAPVARIANIAETINLDALPAESVYSQVAPLARHFVTEVQHQRERLPARIIHPEDAPSPPAFPEATREPSDAVVTTLFTTENAANATEPTTAPPTEEKIALVPAAPRRDREPRAIRHQIRDHTTRSEGATHPSAAAEMGIPNNWYKQTPGLTAFERECARAVSRGRYDHVLASHPDKTEQDVRAVVENAIENKYLPAMQRRKAGQRLQPVQYGGPLPEAYVPDRPKAQLRKAAPQERDRRRRRGGDRSWSMAADLTDFERECAAAYAKGDFTTLLARGVSQEAVQAAYTSARAKMHRQ